MSIGLVLRNGQLRARGSQSPALNGRSGRRSDGRPEARGKFLFVGEEKLHVPASPTARLRATIAATATRRPDVVVADFARMGANDMNAVRTYTVPPRICVKPERT
jgi:hypothetical protein